MPVRFALFVAVFLLMSPGFTFAAAADADGESAAPPAIRRWVDVEQIQLGTRYRWTAATDGDVTASAIQFQPLLRARMPVDAAGRLAVTIGAGAGANFAGGWDNTGAGLGQFSGAFAVKQLLATAEVMHGLEVSAGGLYVLRGESTEITSYDNDGYLVGERAAWQHDEGIVDRIAITTGYLGDLRDPNVFHRLDRLNDWNYEQFLIGWRLGAHVVASTDYTHEGDRSTLREAMTIRLPRQTKLLTALKVDLYERVAPDTARGLHVSADMRPLHQLLVTTGFASVDRAYGGLNADRFDRGNRVYCIGTFAANDVLSLGWFYAEGVANDYAIPNEHRLDIVATINPTAVLRRKRVF